MFEPHYKKLIRTAMMQSYEPNPSNKQQPSGTMNHDKLEKRLQEIMEMQLANQPRSDWAGYYESPMKHLVMPVGTPFMPIKTKH